MEGCWDADPMRRPSLIAIAKSITGTFLHSNLGSDSAIQRIREVPDRWAIPPTWLISTEVKLEDIKPFSSTLFSDVYRGHIGGTLVALKSLRMHVDNRRKVERVSPLSITTTLLRSTGFRQSTVRSRFGGFSGIRTSSDFLAYPQYVHCVLSANGCQMGPSMNSY